MLRVIVLASAHLRIWFGNTNNVLTDHRSSRDQMALSLRLNELEISAKLLHKMNYYQISCKFHVSIKRINNDLI